MDCQDGLNEPREGLQAINHGNDNPDNGMPEPSGSNPARDDPRVPALRENEDAEMEEEENVDEPRNVDNARDLQEMKFLSGWDLQVYLINIASYPENIRSVDDELNVTRLHTTCKNDNNVVDKVMLATYMCNTFKLRMYEIKELKLDVRTIVKHFPGLKCYDLIREEFERVTGKQVKDFEPRVENKIYWGKRDHPRFESLQGEILLNFYSERLTTSRHRLVSYIYHERHEHSKIKSLLREQPTIIILESVTNNHCASVYFKKHKMLSGLSFHKAFLAAYYLYYIFDIEFSAADGKLWTILEDKLEITKAVE